MEAIDLQYLHNRILNFLLDWRKTHSGLTFSLRKSDLSKRLSLGYWFYGNDDYIAISFWTGMDWQSKVPNISFIIVPVTGECFLQFSAKDSIEKNELVKYFFEQPFHLNEVNRAIYTAPIIISNSVGDYLKNIESFLENDKNIIDKIINDNKRKFETKQNSKNRIDFISEEEFAKNLKRTQKFQKKKKSKNLPIGLYEIEIENYGLIKKLLINDIPTDAQWIFFTGENGSGKTTILKALATAITNATLGLGPRTNISSNYSIGLTLHKNGNKSSRHRINKSNSAKRNQIEILSKGFVCFGPVRLNVQEQSFFVAGKSGRKNLLEIFNRPHIQLFSTITPLIDIGFIYNRNIEISKELKSNQEKLRFIIEAITSICDSIVDIHFGKGMRYFEVDKNKNILGKNGTPFQNLASGYKSVIAMISHMMLHLYYQQPEINDPSLLEGIVIIDEIDLHFHPKMQRDLIIKLTEIFPSIQFIASTHSPIPLLGVPANTPIFTSKIDSEKGIYLERMNKDGEISNLLPNSILTSPIFNLQEIISESHKSEELLSTEDNYQDVVFYKILNEKLTEISKKYRADD